ncbi:PAS domain-containing sensor histidine kinase [Phormidesmis priestleyi]
MLNSNSNEPFLRMGAIELSLSQSEELFRAYVEAANDMVYTVDLVGKLTYMNSYGKKLLGCDDRDIVGRPYLEFVSPPFREKTAKAFGNLMSTGQLRDFEFVLQPRVGSEIYLEVNGQLLHRNGELIGGIGIGRDVTERKRIEKQLQMFSRAVESAYDSAVITDLNGEVLYANPAASRIFSWQLGELSGKNSEVFYPERRQTQWLIQQAIAGGWSGEILCNRRNGERFSALVSVGPICDERDNTTAVSFITRDITQQKQIEAELAAKNLELERASRLKSEFLANMSHELRTPLTAILGFSSILRQQIFGSLNPKQEIYIQQINQSGQHLLGLINDVLDLSKVEAGQMRLEIVPIALNELCEDTLGLVSEQARSRKLEVHHSIQLNLPPLMADELRVRQMLLNLLSNAIKFSEEGGQIGLDVEVREGDMQIVVWDKGIGIPEDKQHLLFQPFQQVDGSVSRRHEGTGLGLALTRRLTELHFGTIDVQSQEGQGSRFTIRLPLSHLSVEVISGYEASNEGQATQRLRMGW